MLPEFILIALSKFPSESIYALYISNSRSPFLKYPSPKTYDISIFFSKIGCKILSILVLVIMALSPPL